MSPYPIGCVLRFILLVAYYSLSYWLRTSAYPIGCVLLFILLVASFCLSYWIVYCTAVNTNEPTAGADFQIVRLEALIRGIVDDLYRGSDITYSVM